LTRPRLDFVSNYQVNMFGDTLLSQRDDDVEMTDQGLNSAYETLTQGDQTGWNLGFEFSMPLGFRTARSQVRNLELQLSKARTLLGAQELEVSHELARAFQELDRAYQTAQTNFNRRRAAELRVKAEQNKVDLGLGDQQGQNNVDLLLRAQISLAQAEVAYYSSLVAYNQAVTAIHYRKGSLLEFNNVQLAEGGWDPQAYILALRRAWSRSHALDNEHLLHTEPHEFVTGPEEVHLTMPYEEVQPLMNLNELEPGDSDSHLGPGMLNVPAPTPPSADEEPMSSVPPDSEPIRAYEEPMSSVPSDSEPIRAYEEPMSPVQADPAPMPESTDDALGWRKRDMEAKLQARLNEESQAEPQKPRRAELPIR
jgi:hypothetical protein